MYITLLAGLFVLSVVIIVHEFGHFIVAKITGVFVKTFSVGFGRKLLKKRWGETQYALSVLHFGGYVKFAGETEEGEEEKKERAPEDDEISDSDIDPARYFRNKKIPVKSMVVFAGPLMNYILAVFIYVGVFFFQGLQVLPTTTIGEVIGGTPADSVGLQVGDEIVAIDGKPVHDWSEVLDEVLENRDSTKIIKVARNGETFGIPFKSGMKDGYVVLGFRAYIPARIGRVKLESPAYKAGIRRGAVIEAINDTIITSYHDIERIIHAHPEEKLVIRWSLDGIAHTDTIVPEAKKVLKEGSKTETTVVGQMGVGPYYENKKIGILKSFGMGFSSANGMVAEILGFMKMLLSGKAGMDTLGGPILITQMAGDMARWGFNYLLYFLAFFSINLCIFNLLPVLPFDGGHLFFFLVEGVTRRKVKDRYKEILTQAGFILLIVLMVFVVLMDLSRCSGISPGVL